MFRNYVQRNTQDCDSYRTVAANKSVTYILDIPYANMAGQADCQTCLMIIGFITNICVRNNE